MDRACVSAQVSDRPRIRRTVRRTVSYRSGLPKLLVCTRCLDLTIQVALSGSSCVHPVIANAGDRRAQRTPPTPLLLYRAAHRGETRARSHAAAPAAKLTFAGDRSFDPMRASSGSSRSCAALQRSRGRQKQAASAGEKSTIARGYTCRRRARISHGSARIAPLAGGPALHRKSTRCRPDWLVMAGWLALTAAEGNARRAMWGRRRPTPRALGWPGARGRGRSCVRA
jgi:hypothetical protein